ncbi:hypothetical protein NCCP2716_10910 [Sporosarcina sp. NCCP-2716]|uniref:hypothetical protein n=1 Tax=Sporosarcina sp. NCCP-2716 TaxID=2943679 RepID=UPI00203AAFF3|nr:hypothetical protein [Sporosarcina sp. NCCP-2716]GKV68593.1 hypothetical protein NCCP2716_10910 [Sporosarcina sp. NCCP-2716]
MKKWIALLLGACLMALLAACGNGEAEKENDKNDTVSETAKDEADDTESAEGTADSEEKAEEGATEGDAPAGTVEPDSAMSEMQLGLTAEEFQTNFNHFAEEEGIEERMDPVEWKSSGSGGDHQIVDVQFDEDRRMQLLAKKGDDAARAVMFSTYSDRDAAIPLIRVLIRAVEPSASPEEVDSWMDELKLNGPADEDNEYHFTTTERYHLMTEDGSGFVQFVIGNAEDPEITPDNFEAGEL